MRETSLDDFIGGADEDEGGEPGTKQEDGEPPVPDEVEGDESEHGDPAPEESTVDESDGAEPAEPEVDLAESESGSGSDSDSESDPESESDPAEPTVSTYDWTPTGADCEACGAAVEKRWRDDGRLVCADCKAW